MMQEDNLQYVSKRLLESVEPVATVTRLNQIAKEFKEAGWTVKICMKAKLSNTIRCLLC